MTPSRLSLEVRGELACFTRPELKVERFSYPVITPSAARAIFEAVYRKPRFRWQVSAVEVLEPPRYIALRRNEVKDRAPGADTIGKWATGGAEPQPLWADGDGGLLGTDQKGRTQRQTMALKQVRYRLHAEIRPWPGYEGDLVSFEAQFRRRAAAGQCLYQPYFGCREFPAYFEPCDADIQGSAVPDAHIGWMLYDVFDLSRPGTPYDAPFVTLFDARLEGGVLRVPEFDTDAVRKPPRRTPA